MGRLPTLWCLGITAFTLSACAGRGGVVPYGPAGFGQPDAPASSVTQPAYRVGPGDLLDINVTNLPNMSGEQLVDTSGGIDRPLLGHLQAAGMTTADLGAAIASRLGRDYLQNPQVQVSVKRSASLQVTVEGAVTTPGIYPMGAASISLIQAVALAHGTDKDANPHRVVVFRKIGGQRMAAAFDLIDIQRGKEADPAIYGNDVVVVDSSRARAAFHDFVSAIPLATVFRPF